MPIKYHLVRRPDMRKDAQEGATLYYGQVRASERTTFRELCEEISAYTTATPPDISCVLKGLLFMMKQHLAKGNIVQLGDLGSFRMIAGSRGVEEPDKFHPSLFKKARVLFTPGSLLKETGTQLRFQKLSIKQLPNTSCEEPHAV